METFSTLPENLRVECLIRVPCQEFAQVAAVCKEWKQQLNMPAFLPFRKLKKQNQFFLAVAAEEELTLLEPLTGKEFQLPNTKWVNRYNRITCIGSDLVVMGDKNRVRIYNFMSGTWRIGANMPGQELGDFGYRSDGNRWIYVVGGRGIDGFMKTAMAYDVKEDRWIILPNMIIPRCCSTLIAQNGNILVFGEDHPARSSISYTEVFNINTQQWNESKQISEELDLSFNFVLGRDGNVYKFIDNYVLIRKDQEWCVVAELSSKFQIFKMTVLEEKLIVIGFMPLEPEVVNNDSQLNMNAWAFWENGILYKWPGFESIVAYLFDIKTCQFAKVTLPLKYMESCFYLHVCSV